MTVEAMSGLSMQAGSAVAAAAGRAALWAVSAYMQQPLRNTAVAALIGLSAMAGANILYHQAHHHPAPLFGSFSAPVSAPVAKTRKTTAPVMPVHRPAQLDDETTGSVDSSVTMPALIGRDDVAAVQTKLLALQLLDGKADGIAGPKTNKAIRALEAKLGRPVKGQLTPEIVALIKSTPNPVVQVTAPAQVQQVVPAEPAPLVVAKTIPAPAVEEKPLPAPAPLLQANTQPAEDDTQVAEIAPVNTDNTVVDDAPAVQTLPMTKPNGVTKRSVQTIAVRAQAAPSQQPMPDAIAPDEDAPPATDGPDASHDKTIVASVQKGLNSLGFLHGEISGIADEATSKAIRNFEVYYNYDVTGKISRGLVNLLQQAGAVI